VFIRAEIGFVLECGCFVHGEYMCRTVNESLHRGVQHKPRIILVVMLLLTSISIGQVAC
jgi:hypothetical protein